LWQILKNISGHTEKYKAEEWGASVARCKNGEKINAKTKDPDLLQHFFL
jgi:hypothetical protein